MNIGVNIIQSLFFFLTNLVCLLLELVSEPFSEPAKSMNDNMPFKVPLSLSRSVICG